MLRTIPAHVLVDSELGQIVEPMVCHDVCLLFREKIFNCLFTIYLCFQVWVYVEDVDRFVDSLTWSNYGEVFPHIWVCTEWARNFFKKNQINQFYKKIFLARFHFLPFQKCGKTHAKSQVFSYICVKNLHCILF